MPKKRAKQGKRFPYPHVVTKNCCYVHCPGEDMDKLKVSDIVEEVYGAYPIRFVAEEADLESL